MKIRLLSILMVFSVQHLLAQHNEIIFDVPTDVSIYIEHGDFYWIDWNKFEVEGRNYVYDQYTKKDDKTIYRNHNSGIILLEGAEVYPLISSHGRFQGPSGSYRVIFNVDISHSLIDAEATFTLVNKQTHLKRNKYNKIAKGILVRKAENSKVFVDENGCEWELQSQRSNLFHDPKNNVKLLHKIPSGGEYETIRKILPNEGNFENETLTTLPNPCGGISWGGIIKIVDVTADTLSGPNITISNAQSSYNFGHTGLLTFFKHCHLDMKPHDEWGGEYVPTPSDAFMTGCKSSTTTASTLFLLDVSGSMGDAGKSGKSKLEESKSAADATLNSIESSNQAGTKTEVAVMSFSGSCAAPIRDDSGFTENLNQIRSTINGLRAGGGTPLAEAIRVAECALAQQLHNTQQTNGKLIIMSDGVATCERIRPNDVYAFGQSGQVTRQVNAQQHCTGQSANVAFSNTPIKYYTIGFGIAPGSPAERDLQYLAQTSGGKYLNVQNQTQLERAFRKFNRTYIPKPNPAISGLSSESRALFQQGVNEINTESFKRALQSYESYTQQHQEDCHGAYNLALMQEASDQYQEAIASYQRYLSLCPSANDKARVEKQIVFLEEEFKQFLIFQKKVVESDLAYLKLHFEKIQHGESVALADEFKGFLKEKDDYYEKLPQLMGYSNRLFKRYAQAVAEGLSDCNRTINKSRTHWDRDATPVLSTTYLSLERLLEQF